MAASGGAPIAPSLIPGGAGVHNAQSKPGSPAKINGAVKPSRPGAAPGRIGGRQGGGGGPAKQPGGSKPSGQFGLGANNPLLNPSQPLSGQSLYQAAQGLAQAQTQPAIKALTDQIAQNQQQTTGAENLTGGYFQQLGQQAQQGLAAQQGISNTLNDQLKQLASDQSSQLQGLGQQDAAMLAKYSPQSDSSNSLLQPGLSALTSELARQQGLQAQQQGAARAFGLNQGANYQGLAASNLGSFASRGEEDLNQIAQAGQIKNQPLTSKIAQLQGTYGATLASDLGKLRQQEITNQIARSGLGIKQATLNNTIANDQATQKINAGKLGVDQQNANTNATKANTQANQQAFNNNPNAVGSPAWERVQNSNAKNFANNPTAIGSAAWGRVQSANKASGKTARQLTPLENNRGGTYLNEIRTAIETWNQQGMKNSKGVVTEAHPTPQQERQVLGGKYDANLVEATFELMGYGSIDQNTANNLAAEGYNIKAWSWNNQPIKVTPNYNPNTPAGGAAQVLKSLGNTF